MNNKKVVHMTTVHHPFDTRIYHKQCHSLHKAGYDVTLIAPASVEEREQSEIRIVPVQKRTKRLARMILSTWEAYQKARALQADYYHIHDPELLPVAWLLKDKGNVVIYDIHEDYVTSIRQKEYLPKLVRRWMASLYKLIEKLFSRPLALCLAEKYYEDHYPKGQCILNYPKLNETLINHDREERQADDALIYTGNVDMDRGAFNHAALPHIDPQVSVHLIGKCPRVLAEQMYDIAGPCQDRLFITGIDQYVPREHIDDQYVSRPWLAGLALFPPTEHYMKKELTKFFEYMSASIPIICSHFPVWKGFIDTYQCGITVDPDNEEEVQEAIQYLRSHPNEASQMGKNGKKAVLESLNWQVEEAKLIQWYHDLWTEQTQ